jgi:hypothetical protein
MRMTKRPYTPPVLAEYGKLAELTAGSGAGRLDVVINAQTGASTTNPAACDRPIAGYICSVDFSN